MKGDTTGLHWSQRDEALKWLKQGAQVAQKDRMRYSELQEAIDYMKTQQNGLMTAMERKNKLADDRGFGGDSEHVLQGGPELGAEAH